MSLPESGHQSLFAAGNEFPDLLPQDDPMMIFAQKIFPSFSDEEFEECYSENGRPAISPSFLACVTLLQFREHMSDTEAAQAVIRRLDWKIALHLPVGQSTSFDPSTLVYFRRRLKENGKMRLIFDKTIEIAKSLKLIKKRANQRVDATHVVSHVNRIATTDLLFRAVKCLAEEVEKKAPEFYEAELPEYLRERYENRFSSFGMSKEKRADRMAEIVEDGRLLASIIREDLPERIEEFEQLPIMETIFEENVVVTEKSVDDKVVLEVEEITRPKQTVFDPRDTSIQLGRKGKASWVGSKCHIVETAEAGKTNYITNMIYQTAHHHDRSVHETIRKENERLDLHPRKLFADTNYVSGEAIKIARENGTELMGYMQGVGSKREKEFLPDAFKIDMQNLTAVCPAGHRNRSARIDGLRGDRTFTFDPQTCQSCGFFDRCVRSTSKKTKSRKLLVHEHYEYVRERRKQQKRSGFKKQMRVRAQVEGTISEAIRFHGLRFARYRGELGHELQFYLTGAAINMKRIAKAVQKKSSV